METLLQTAGTDDVGVLIESLEGKDFAEQVTLNNLKERFNTDGENEVGALIESLENKVATQAELQAVKSELETIKANQTNGEQLVKQDGSIDEDKRLLDYPTTPGHNQLIAGDRNHGFFGFVEPNEFGEIENNPDGSKEFDGDNLALALGISQGTSQFVDTPWMKFYFRGKMLFVPVKTIRRSISWNTIYEAGAVYGDDTVGTLPPNGRAGPELSIDGTDNSINIDTDTDGGFLRDDAVIAEIGDTIVLAGWEEDNDGEYEVLSITDEKIEVDEDLNAAEGETILEGEINSRIWNKADEVTQNAIETIGGNDYRIRLMRGAADDPTDSYGDSDRGSRGEENEWNALMLPIHYRAKENDWNYNDYAPESVDNWQIGLNDKDMMTHRDLGGGSYAWCQETRENSESYRRVVRGGTGVSDLGASRSWDTRPSRGFRPVLELVE